MKIVKNYKYRLYPNKRQQQALQRTLDLCRALYNACLEERKEAYLHYRRSFNTPTGIQVIEASQTKEEKAKKRNSSVEVIPASKLTKNYWQEYIAKVENGEIERTVQPPTLSDLSKVEVAATTYLPTRQTRQNNKEFYAKPELPDFYSQQKQLKHLRSALPELTEVYSSTLEDVIGRVDKTFKAFMSRVVKGDRAGFPRFKSYSRYDTFLLGRRHGGAGFDPEHGNGWLYDSASQRLTLGRVGGLEKVSVKMRQHRPFMLGKVVQLSIHREAGNKWYAMFAMEQADNGKEEPKPKEHFDRPAGMNRGLVQYAVLSDGMVIPKAQYDTADEEKYFAALLKANPTTLSKLERNNIRRRLAKTRTAAKADELRRLADLTKKKGSRRWRTMLGYAGKASAKLSRQRKDALHYKSRRLVEKGYDALFWEDYDIKKMLARPAPVPGKQPNEAAFLPNGAGQQALTHRKIADAAWATFTQFVKFKAAEAGIFTSEVGSLFISQDCPKCDTRYPPTPKREETRVFSCVECQYTADVDLVAAQNVLKKGLLEAHALLYPAGDTT